jgi:glycosyl transferase-like sugar-binding protein
VASGLRLRILKKRVAFLRKWNAHNRLFKVLEQARSHTGDWVAGQPFVLLDDLLDQPATDPFVLQKFCKFLPEGQRPLFMTVLNALQSGSVEPLADLINDDSTHPETRFEAKGWLLFLSHRDKSEHTAPVRKTAPPELQVFQFWDSRSPPPEIQRATGQWKSLPGVSHHLFDQDSAYDFIARHYGPAEAEVFAGCWHPALSSDLFRLCYLYKMGGIYADADSLPAKGTVDFLNRQQGGIFASSATNVPKCVAQNFFLGAGSGSRLIGGFLERVLKNIAAHRNGPIFWISGPAAFTQYLFDAHQSGQTDGLVLFSHNRLRRQVFRQIEADYKLTDRNWRVFEHQRQISDLDGLQIYSQNTAKD